MTRVGVIAIVLGALAIAGVARSGHELPIYPSFYPHEIDIRAVAPEQAADQLRQGKIQAYVGRELSFPATPPAEIGTIESLGSRACRRSRSRPASLSRHAVPRRLPSSRRPRSRRQGAFRGRRRGPTC